MDFILQDIVRPEFGRMAGAELVKAIRNTHDDVLINDCLRLRHLPIVIHTAGGFDIAQELKRSSPELQILPRVSSYNNLEASRNLD